MKLQYIKQYFSNNDYTIVSAIHLWQRATNNNSNNPNMLSCACNKYIQVL